MDPFDSSRGWGNYPGYGDEEQTSELHPYIESQISEHISEGHNDSNRIARLVGQGVRPDQVARCMQESGVQLSHEYMQGSSSSSVGGYAPSPLGSASYSGSGYGQAPGPSQQFRD